jgi:hypothetical protein
MAPSEAELIAWHAVNALIEDAKSDFRGPHGEDFAWAIYNAVVAAPDEQLIKLRVLLRKRGVTPGAEVPGSWMR